MTEPFKIEKHWRILIVDDHHLTREMVRAILGGLGFSQFAMAENALVAFKVLQEQLRVDLIVCDWNMPHATGLDFLKRVRADARYKNIPFLMLTAEAYRETVEVAVAAGVSDYAVKPFTAQTLGDKVINLLSRKGRTL